MERLQQTPSQTVGPFFAYSLTAVQYGYDYNSIINGSLLDDDAEGERIYITGNIFDGNGNTISDAMIELWQADANGNYRLLPIAKANDGFTGFGRMGTGTNDKHRFTFVTVKPGAVNGQSPHINVILFMRGSLHTLYTRIYFSDEVNDQDILLNAVDAPRRQTLIATPKEMNGIKTYHFDIYMQGQKETVFFKL
ncbi:MAG TPA: protocatechuate 3,4-dioxygenase subunit alpha [Panacibacter sp.]|nr:protocatechuate 3,4-dioxygenase subunit alpha [Panacibacter sp.]